jgi:glycosyltransferase involved in cell wall biosynthesis
MNVKLSERQLSKITKKIFLTLSELKPGGGAEAQILLHLAALRKRTSIDSVILCGKHSPVEGEFVEHSSLSRMLFRKGFFISYLSRDHFIGFLRKLIFRGPWIPFERTHPGFYEAIGKKSITKKLKHALQVILYSVFPDKIFVQTQSARDRWSQKLPFFPSDKIIIVPNIYTPQPGQFFSYGNIPRIILVGRLIEIKDYPLALAAFHLLAKNIDFCVDIYGEGEDRDNIMKLAANLGLAKLIKFHGFVSDREEIFRGATLLVMTSQFEGSPNAIGEAMAHGIPIVTVDFDAGPRDMLGPDENQIVKVRDPKAISDLIIKHLENPDWSEDIGESNRRRILQNYSEDIFASKFLTGLERI